ncbi:VOC family protein [Phenylobacterium sp. LjRoot219]|uniref:VOC family protein n=1 Tax=Phenylobacterium sp. LjRoot219 TaxID=3342283 RepID=UPI003ECDF019
MTWANNLRHFAIECNDVERAKAFYEQVFGWVIRPWGPPGFYQILTGNPADPGVLGALQERHAPLTGSGSSGVQPTFGVEDLTPVVQAVDAHGGRVVMPEFRIEGVGNLIYFEDTEGNRIGAMKYDREYAWPQGVSRPA